MDILNIISWVKGKRQVTSVDPTKSVIPVGLKDDRRDDGYLAGVITVEDLLAGSASSIATDGTSLYSTDPVAGPNISSSNTIALGVGAGENTVNAPGSNFIGYHAGQEAASANFSNFIGFTAGVGASAANESNFIGYNTGINASQAYYSNFLGSGTGSSATYANESNFLGINSGAYATNAYRSNFLGTNAGYGATSAHNSNFIGATAGFQATNANNSNFIGREAGRNAPNANSCNFIGLEAGINSSGNNVNGFGYQAHRGGSLSGQTVFSNSSLASYLDRATAVAAITVPLGASAGSTYLYYNQTTFAIEAVRL